MTQYKYYLDKSSKKFNCPQCNKKGFVKFIETETGHYAESQYGRCDREVKCGYMQYPTNNSIINYNYIAPPPAKPSYIDKKILQETLNKYEKNPLATFLYSHYSEDEVKNTFEKYQVGTANMFNGSTVFWQIDNTGNVHTGKIMAYDSSTGNRIKNKHITSITWVHCKLKIPKDSIRQCLFGLHLLNETTKQIAIVESEKTALIMSIEFPQHTWMSTGSLHGFKYEYLEPLKNYKIIAFPDKGGYSKWEEKTVALNEKGFNIEVSEFLEKAEYEDGWDLVDVIQYKDI